MRMPIDITARQLTILDYIAQGYTDREIGALLFLSYKTVRAHFQNLRRTMGARNRPHAVALAYEWGWLPGRQEEVLSA